MVLSNGFTRDPRVVNEAEGLVRNGFEVTVLSWDRDGTLPPQETLNGIRVVRLRNTAWMGLLPYDLFRLRPFWRLALRRARGLHASTPLAAIHCHDLDTLPVGTSSKRRTGLPLIYDAHEIWGYLMAHELPGDWGELLSPERKTPLAERVPRDHRERAPAGLLRGRHGGPGHRCDERKAFRERNVSRAEQRGVHRAICWPASSVAARSKELPNVEFLGEGPFRDVIPLTLKADAVLAPFDPGHKLTRVGLPNKLFEAMATGRPIIVTNGTYLAEFTKEHGVGLVVAHSVEGVREGLRRLGDDPRLSETLGRHGLEKALSEFNGPRQEQTLLGVYSGLGLT